MRWYTCIIYSLAFPAPIAQLRRLRHCTIGVGCGICLYKYTSAHTLVTAA